MYNSNTVPQRVRLPQSDINRVKEYFQAPLNRVINRVLALYLHRIQRTGVIPRDTLYRKWTPGTRQAVSLRLRHELVEYMELNRMNKTTTILEALFEYEGYVIRHPSELDLIRHNKLKVDLD